MRSTYALVLILVISLHISACANHPPQESAEIGWATAISGKADVYGDDSRREINDPSVSDEARLLGRSIPMVLNVRQVFDYGEEEVRFTPLTMSNKYQSEIGAPLCAEEPFSSQPAPGYCTAFLIAPDLVATAGHCVNGHTRCAQMGFAFGYAKTRPDKEAISVPRRDFYRCEQVVGRLYNRLEEEEVISSKEYWYDWAVLRLDRPVQDREPLTLAGEERIGLGQEISVIGHPAGLAMKYTTGVVMADDKERYINTSLDIYQGNSGSPAIDLQSGEVQGIAIRGSGGSSFEVTEAGCGLSKVCVDFGAPGCTGNHILRIDPIKAFIEEGVEVIERHRLAADDNQPGFSERFHFDEEGEVRFATVNINGRARDSRKIQVLLHHGEQSVTMMNHPYSLPYGRWTASSEAFSGANAEGEWRIEVIDEGGSEVFIEWTQVILGVLR